jgi:polysaccharide export outer membrane protein
VVKGQDQAERQVRQSYWAVKSLSCVAVRNVLVEKTMKKWVVIVAVLSVFMFIDGKSTHAQDIGSLRQILTDRLGEIGEGGSIGQIPLDEAIRREQLQLNTIGRHVEESVKTDSEKQLELRELARQRTPTALEEDYSRRTGSELKQFGYDLFREKPESEVTTIRGSVQDDYILGIDDILIVTFRGQESKSGVTRVDTEGRVILLDLPPISAAGRTFGDFRQELEAVTEMTMLGTQVFVSLAKVRDITVLVAGEVERPAYYSLSALSSVLDALSLSGGIKKSGSLRQIQVVRGDQISWVDLYDLVLLGAPTRNLILRDGDRIVVPLIGDTVAVSGWVNRPGIYELREGEKATSVEKLLALSGGAVRPTGYRILHISLQEDGHQKVEERNFNENATVEKGDVLIVELSQDVQYGSVKTVGHVRVSNHRSLFQAPTLSALLNSGSILQENPYLLFAAIETTDTRTRTRRMYPVNLQSVIAGEVDYRLHDQDVVLVFSSKDVIYLSSAEVQHVLAQGEDSDRASPCRGVQALQTMIVLGGAGKFDGASLYLPGLERNGELKLGDKSRLELERFKLERRRVELDERATKLRELQARMDANPLKTDLLETAFSDREKSACPQIFEEYPKALPMLLEHALMLQGEVRAPGIYPVIGGTQLDTIISAAEGLSREADLSNVEFSHYGNSGQQAQPQLGRQVKDLSQTSLASVSLNPGDVVKVGRNFTSRDSGLVMLQGEFKQPGRYTINRGERLSEIIARAGGLTPYAYPYGAVFVRESAKRREKLGFERSALEMEGALATALSSPSTAALGLGAASQAVSKLVETLRSAEPVGRVVMEADPTVLQIRPDLDIILEPGDILVMPKRPSSVVVTGEVLNPGAMQFMPGLNADDYIDMAGGLGQAADDGRIFVVLPNGVAKPLSISYWNYDSVKIPPGSTVVVPRDATPLDIIAVAKDLTQIFSQLAIGAASLSVLND